MLTQAVCEAYVEHHFPWCPRVLRKRLVSVVRLYIPRLSDIERFHAPVLKTHDCFRASLARGARCVFLFGDPLESAQSVARMGRLYGCEWIEDHIYHLASEGDPKSIFHSDVLNYEYQLRCWSTAGGVFLVHYDDLWDRLPELCQYLGLDLVLPERRDRSSKSPPSNYDRRLFQHLRDLEKEVRAKSLSSR